MQSHDRTNKDGNSVELIGNGLKTTFPSRAEAVTPADGTVFTVPSVIYVGGGGNVSVVPWDPLTPGPITYIIPDGGVVPVAVRTVRSTGTTATSMVRHW